ncbi:hypothetical protein ABT186_37945 [Streptomyces sp. NPDC001634]|uniref:hypothetical protein n=1 Tax=Streptomyces sp. NPDC001634 TaxID=3154390 RepID=UPI003332F4B9
MVQTLAAAGELQRDLQRELTYDGLRAAEAKGSKDGRRPAVPADKTDVVRAAYLENRPIAALAREHGVSRGAIRTAVADLMPQHAPADREDAPAPETPVTLDMPGKVADFLRAADLGTAERAALDQGVPVRHGQGYTLRVGATPSVHRQILARCQPLNGGPAVPAQRKARREYENRVNALAGDNPVASRPASKITPWRVSGVSGKRPQFHLMQHCGRVAHRRFCRSSAQARASVYAVSPVRQGRSLSPRRGHGQASCLHVYDRLTSDERSLRLM